MTEGATLSKRARALIIVVTWILSLITTFTLVYFAPSIFPPLHSANIADEAIITVKLADGTVTSAKILDGAVTAVDLANNSVTNIKIADGAVSTAKIADDAVTNNKLAPSAIPYASTFSTTDESTSLRSYVDMPNTSVNITLTRTSHLIIMFSGEAWVDGAADSILIQALVDSTVANPSGALVVLTTAGIGQHGVNSFVFYLPNVNAGTHTVRIQWMMLYGMNMGHVAGRTLNVIALPA